MILLIYIAIFIEQTSLLWNPNLPNNSCGCWRWTFTIKDMESQPDSERGPGKKNGMKMKMRSLLQLCLMCSKLWV
uniref:Uncharacterized protein n=1 Tax=Helianthus annuus TaxID=4232 RepID=A0A251UN27_HELAN